MQSSDGGSRAVVHLQSAAWNSDGYSWIRAMNPGQIPYFTDNEVEVLKDKTTNQIIDKPSYCVRETEWFKFLILYHFSTICIRSS